ncbi:MAG: hypothetical protein AAF533_29340 [Acidobacteriota bacterium]
MKKYLLGALGVVVGLAVGMAVNMALVTLNTMLHAPEGGVDWQDEAATKAFMASLPFLGFVVVWLAHSGQAFVGSLVGTLVSGRRSVVVGLIIGVLTLAGCVMALFMFPGPIWFGVVDVLLPVPVAWLAARLVLKKDA